MIEYTGKFIVFEGIDDYVLTDQSGRLNEWLRSNMLTVVVTREPTDGPVGAQSRLVFNKRLEVDDLAEAALLLSDRMDHLRSVGGILDDIQKGKYVVCIHYLLFAYTYKCEKISLEWLRKINRRCVWPDLVVFIDTPVISTLERQSRREGYDASVWQQKKVLLEEQRTKYLQTIEYCQKVENQVSIIDGNKPAETIHRLCRALVEKLGVKE
jgi:dTMP kinase